MHSAPDNPVEPRGLPDDRVDTLFSCLNSFSNLALAVSGGADSLSLLVLFSEWRRRTRWPGSAEVLCVDHRLRPESAAEADFVAEAARSHGLSCTRLTWHGDKPGRNIQEEARRARYSIMAERMCQSGAEALVLGHHLDDQAETFLDRLTRGSGVSGLSAMAADEPDGPSGLRLLRPFLEIPKEKLEASLVERGIPWCSDPSNLDPKYKRSRLRAVMSLLEGEGLSAERIGRTAANIRRAREALEATARDLAFKHVEEHPAGPLRLERSVYRTIAEDLRLRLLNFLAMRARGLPARQRLEKLETLDRWLMSQEKGRHTLSGAVFEAGDFWLWCWREPGRNPPETLTGLAGTGTWDNRFRYYVTSNGVSVTEGTGLALGPIYAAPVVSREIDWPDGWPKAAFDCAPAVWMKGEIVWMALGFDTNANGNSAMGAALKIERLPFADKLMANLVEDGGEAGEI
ncbi:tRNA lysidine(34) synthetase TilS [Roseibium sp. M-1]